MFFFQVKTEKGKQNWIYDAFITRPTHSKLCVCVCVCVRERERDNNTVKTLIVVFEAQRSTELHPHILLFDPHSH